jgi:hypothetical protein
VVESDSSDSESDTNCWPVNCDVCRCGTCDEQDHSTCVHVCKHTKPKCCAQSKVRV